MCKQDKKLSTKEKAASTQHKAHLVAQNPAIPEAEQILHSTIVNRSTKALKKHIHGLSNYEINLLHEQQRTLDDIDLLINVIETILESKLLTDTSSERKFIAKSRLWRLLSDNGGVLSVEEVSNLLDIGANAVRKRVRRGTLIGIHYGRHLVIPAWQFSNTGQILPNYERILKKIEFNQPLNRIHFFLTPTPYLGTSPLDAIRAGMDLDIVEQLASQYGHQIAR